jgi:hypothetical protein
MGRIVGEVVQANKAVADKVPGLGALVALGTSTAANVVGAAGRPDRTVSASMLTEPSPVTPSSAAMYCTGPSLTRR